MTITITFWNDREPLEIEADDLRSAVVKAVSVGANLYGASLSGANLSGANLYGASLYGASLYGASLSGANLSGASLSGANLYGASLYRASLNGANLNGASLNGANLDRANLDRANLDRANLNGASLNGANLNGASLNGANLNGASLDESTTLPPFQIVPEEGVFTAYKKVRDENYNDVILTLEIPAEAKRTSSLVGRKCRASAVKVIKAEPEGGAFATYHSSYDHDFTYRVGETVSVPDFDDDIRIECTRGIHFFITKKEAIEY